MSALEAYRRMVEMVQRKRHDPRWWRNTLDWLWEQLTDDEKENAPAIPFPTD